MAGRGPAAAAFAAYSLLTLAMTWPWARAPHELAPLNGDLLGHVWGIAWVATRGLADPVRLYDANMYFPETLSLAYTESLIPQALQALPVFWLGGGPLLAHNLVLLASFPLSGLGALLLARELGSRKPGAFFAGLAYAFTAFRFEHVVHVGVISVQWLPFVLLLLLRSVRRPTLARVALLGGFCWLQALSSGYHAVILAAALLAAGAVLARTALRRRSALPVSAALLVAALMVGLSAWPYLELKRRHQLGRGREAYLHWSARPLSFLETGRWPALPHQRWLRDAARERMPLFPGTPALALAAWGASRPRRRLPLVLAATGLLLSLGPELRLPGVAVPMPFDLLRLVPPMDLMRDPSRFAFLFQLGLALLAGRGLGRLLSRRGGRVAAALALALQAAESWPAGLGATIVEIPPPPPAVRWLAGAPPGPVLELPWDNRQRSAGHYLYWSTAHWRPMVNGHGTFQPPGALGLGVIAQTFPSEPASQMIRGRGVRHVVVHGAELSAERRTRVFGRNLPQGVRLVARFGSDYVYEIDPQGPRRRQPRYEGAPLTAPASARRPRRGRGAAPRRPRRGPRRPGPGT
jgi:hypothetical protein